MKRFLLILFTLLLCLSAFGCTNHPQTSESGVLYSSDSGDSIGSTASSESTESKASAMEESAVLSDSSLSHDLTSMATVSKNPGTVSTSTPEISFSPLVVSNKKFSSSTKDMDSLLAKNPSRGWRTHTYWYVDWALNPQKLLEVSAQYGKRWENRYQYWENQYSHFFNTGDDYTATAFTYIYLTGYENTMELPQEALDCIEEFFDFVRKKKFTMLLDFCYCDEATQLETCADEGIMIAHMRQLAPIVKRNADVVHCIKAGFVGAYGEWAYQDPPVNYSNVTRGILKFFCEPTGLQYLARLPKYKNSIGKKDPLYSRIGFSNDAVYGEQTRTGWESGGFQLGTDAWDQVCREGAFAPNDAEMCTNHQMNEYFNPETGTKGIIPYGIDVIAEAAHHWFCTMSVWHGNHDYNSNWDSVRIMDTWKKQNLTPQMLQERNIVYDPSWFQDKNGKAITRNCFEFLRDHLGYRIELQNVSVTKDGSVTLKLKNYGMAAAFRMKSGFALLDENYNVVSIVKAGEPETWYSHDPYNWLDTHLMVHTVQANIRLPQKKGNYYLAFYLKNDLDMYAYMSNTMDRAGGYHILHAFSL